jgi:hypothetical protein
MSAKRQCFEEAPHSLMPRMPRMPLWKKKFHRETIHPGYKPLPSPSTAEEEIVANQCATWFLAHLLLNHIFFLLNKQPKGATKDLPLTKEDMEHFYVPDIHMWAKGFSPEKIAAIKSTLPEGGSFVEAIKTCISTDDDANIQLIKKNIDMFLRQFRGSYSKLTSENKTSLLATKTRGFEEITPDDFPVEIQKIINH